MMNLIWIPFLFFGIVASVPLNKLTVHDIIRVREQFMQETLSKPKYKEMRASMERRARAPPRVFDQPMNPELAKRIKELEESAKQDQKLRDMVTGPNLEETNRPIFDMLHQGDMLLNNQQMRAIEHAERRVILNDQVRSGEMFGRHGILAADPPFLPHKRSKRQILSATKYGFPKTKWDTNSSISYYFEFDIDDELKEKIREAVKFWQENSCLSFKENGTVEPKIRYFRGAGCYSSVGKQYEDFEQDISLGTGCELFGVASHETGSVKLCKQHTFSADSEKDFHAKRPADPFLSARKSADVMHIFGKQQGQQKGMLLAYFYGTHETGHSLGLFHHQSRFDRDNSIDLVTANIPAQWMGQFNKVDRDTATTLDVGYDYGSDLHYPGYDQRSSKVMLAAKKKPYQHTMGNRRQPTFLDLKLVNEFYECPKKCPKHPNCKNDGFVNPNNCKTCICPSGFSGDDCSKRAPGAFGMPENCGKEIQATESWQTLEGESTAKGKLDKAQMTLRQAECHYHIKAPAGQQVELRVEKITGECTNECYYGATEIKFENKQMTGARLCCPGHVKDIGGALRTTDGLAIVSAYSQKNTQKFQLRYRAVQMDNQEARGSGEEVSPSSSTSTDSTNSISTTSRPHVDRITEPTDQPFGITDQATTEIPVNQPTTFSGIPTEPRQETTRRPTRRPPVPSTTSNCRDIAINCQFQLQYCRSAPAAMKIYCQRSCGFCQF